MTTCPVCEHQQDLGFECEVCGKDLGGLAGLGPPPAREERLEGLEPNAAELAADAPVERLLELEVTRYDQAALAPLEEVAGLELNQLEQVGEVTVEPVPDRSEDRAPDDGQRTVLATDRVTCRYCRQEQPLAATCLRCGMSLPRLEPELGAFIVGTAEEVFARCRACGTRNRAGQRCTDCGTQVPYP
jgi:hypothetical protein